MAIPEIIFIILPIPSALLALLLILYHSTPLLRLLEHPPSILSALGRIIPHPRRNLPREFFNLPPRPSDEDEDARRLSVSTVLGVRGKLMLLLDSVALLSIGSGWGYLLSSLPSAMGGLAVSVSLLPMMTMWLAIFVNSQYSSPDAYPISRLDRVRRSVIGEGGITHATLPRIGAYSLIPTVILTAISAAAPTASGVLLLTSASACLAITLAVSIRARYRGKVIQRGMIRLHSPCPSPLPRAASPYQDERKASPARSESGMEGLSDWVSSPGDAPTVVSAFSYSPSHITPHASRSTTANGSPTSWLTSPTTTPATIPEWEYSPSVSDSLATPARAKTRSRSPSPSPTLPALPRPPSLNALSTKASGTTLGDRTYITNYTSTPGSAIRGADGSVLGAYSPGPFEPLPRGYESLATYPISPEDRVDGSRVTLATHPGNSVESFAFVPSNRGPSASRAVSTWTLESYHSALESFQTPVRAQRRAAPPPPMPDLPLPPTPSAGRSETLFDWPAAKESAEMLLAERDWVSVDDYVAGSEGWSESGKVGIIAVAGAMMCYVSRLSNQFLLRGFPLVFLHSASHKGGERRVEMNGREEASRNENTSSFSFLPPSCLLGRLSLPIPLPQEGAQRDWNVCSLQVLAVPILVRQTDTTRVLYLISLLLLSPLLATVSYLLRYRPATIALPVTSTRSAKGSTTSNQLSLAFRSESQLSLPLSISPKLTPPAPPRPNVTLGNRLPRLLEPKPSISNFGWTRAPPNQRHTMYVAPSATLDLAAEDAMRRTMARRSADVWVTDGHAHASDSILKRAAEMLKPVPALRVLEGPLSAPLRPIGQREAQEGMMKKLRGGITELIPARWSQQSGQFNDANNEMRISTEMVAVPHSPIAIEITSPSKYDRRRVSGVSTYEGEGETEGTLEVEGLGEVKMAQKGRMSASPTFVFTGQRSPTEDGYELDWVTAGVLPGLVPAIKIEGDIRVRPSSTQIDPEATPKKNAIHSRAESLGGTPRGHGRSTSIDYNHASASPVKSSMRNRTSPMKTHASTLSLPDIAPANFDDVRRSVEVTGRDDYGVDLPPFPTIDFSRPRGDSSEPGDESLSAMAAICLEAEMTLRTPRHRLQSDATTVHLTPATRNLAAIARRAEDQLKTPTSLRSTRISGASRFADATPEITPEMINSFRSNLASRTPSSSATNTDRSRLSPRRHASISDEVGTISMISEDQAMADEMEQVLLMDSPKRAEYVISPPPSDRGNDAASLRTKSSRASWMAASEHLYDLDRDTFGAPRKASSASTFASTYTGWSEDLAQSLAPPVPPLPAQASKEEWKFPTYPPRAATSSHPHPTRPTSGLDEHLPIQPHLSMQSLLRKKSAETVSSVSTFEHSPPKLEPTKKEMEMLQTLRERAAPPTMASKGLEEGAQRKGLRELKLVNAENTKRASRLGVKEGNRSSVLGKSDGLPKPPTRTPLSPSKASRGSGKENAAVGIAAKRSKASAGSGLVGLRA